MDAAPGRKDRPRVGLVWSGNAVHKNDRNRSLVLAELIAHLPQAFDYISLQKEFRPADLQTLEPASGDPARWTRRSQDFTDTAALCELVDVVISVDTSVAHLAGALGRPVWIALPLNPDWRWMLERSDSPWYDVRHRCTASRRPGSGGLCWDAWRPTWAGWLPLNAPPKRARTATKKPGCKPGFFVEVGEFYIRPISSSTIRMMTTRPRPPLGP